MASWGRDPSRLSGEFTVFRQVGVGFPPLWLPGSSARPTPQPSARWHREGRGFVQYCAFETDGAWAELVRYEHIRTEADRVGYRLRLWQLWPAETDIADLGSFDTIERCGLDPAILVDDDHRACRDLAEELITAGYRGIVYPSASLPGATNLALFGARRELERGVRNPRPELYIPVSVVAESPPPEHVLRSTRYIGEPHRGYLDWLAAKSP